LRLFGCAIPAEIWETLGDDYELDADGNLIDDEDSSRYPELQSWMVKKMHCTRLGHVPQTEISNQSRICQITREAELPPRTSKTMSATWTRTTSGLRRSNRYWRNAKTKRADIMNSTCAKSKVNSPPFKSGSAARFQKAFPSPC